MKKLLIIVAIAAAVGAGAYYAATRLRPAASTPERPQAAWEAYGYQLHEGPSARRYNMAFMVAPHKDSKPNVRLLLDVQDPKNYYFVELGPEAVRVGKVQFGFETELTSVPGEALGGGKDSRVVVKRRDALIEVVVDGLAIARAEDATFHGGRIGAGVRDGSATVKFRSLQPCEPFLLEDGFMRSASESGAWEVVDGAWRLAGKRNPSLSSNPFHFEGASAPGAPGATALRGEPFWDSYRFRVASASDSTEDVGIYFYYQDADNYWLFRWNADEGAGGQRGRKQLVRRRRGSHAVVAEAPGGYQPGVWYELEAQVAGPRIRVAIDGREVFAVTDPQAAFGKVGLYSAVPVPHHARFDDVEVHTLRALDEDFATEVAGRWRPLRGTWTRQSEGPGHALVATTDEPAKAIATGHEWPDCSVAAEVQLPAQLEDGSELGLVARYQDEMNHALFAWRPARGTARLVALVDGERVDLDAREAPRSQAGERHRLELVWTHTVVQGRVDGRVVVSARVTDLPSGKIGLYAAGVDGLAFRSTRVALPQAPERVPTHKVFERELTMKTWAGATSDWYATQERVEGQAFDVQWHRADFFGDVTLEARLDARVAEAAAGDGAPHACRLVLGAESTDSVRSGYNFALAWPSRGQERRPWRATISRQGRVVESATLGAQGPVHALRFRRIGRHVVASVDGRVVLGYRDPQPLEGCRVAFATHNLAVRKDDVTAFSDHVKVYTFGRAPRDWRPAAGTWEVTSRWECDPRWSFFSGVPDSSRLAALWNKYGFEGDVSVEFAVGPKMDSSLGGGNYQKYTRDFNVVLCADGQHLDTGYGFLFGGWDNSATAITRNGKPVARSGMTIPASSGIHRRWFYIKAEKRGNTLNLWIDGSRVLTYTDPDPLRGNRVAIWSWDCGIMVSRVRISASTLTPKEPPGTHGGPCRTLYSSSR